MLKWYIYIYFHRFWKVNDIYTFFFKGTFNLQIFFILFYKSSKGKIFFFWLSGDYRLPHFPFFLSSCLSCLSFPFKKNLKKIFPPHFRPALFFPSLHFLFSFFSPFLYYSFPLLTRFFFWAIFPNFTFSLLCFFLIIYLFFPIFFNLCQCIFFYSSILSLVS